MNEGSCYNKSSMSQSKTQTLAEVAKTLQAPRYAIRNLCNAGLIPHLRRDRRGFRVFEPWQIDLLQVLLNMKRAGFDRKELRKYSKLCRQGAQTFPERLALFQTRKRQLWQEIADRQTAIDFIERWEETHQN